MNREDYEKLDGLARSVLKLSRNTLVINLRFMDTAISRLRWISLPQLIEGHPEYRPLADRGLLTEGTAIVYNPISVCRAYSAERENGPRAYLHILLHCIFRHFTIDPTVDRELWDIACDMAVEGVINGLSIAAVTAQRCDRQQQELQAVAPKVKQLITAEKLYHWMQGDRPSQARLAQLKQLFSIDDHDLWYASGATQALSGLGADRDDGEEDGSSGKKGRNAPNGSDDGGDDEGQEDGSGSSGSNRGKKTGKHSGSGDGAGDGEDGHRDSAGRGGDGEAGDKDSSGDAGTGSDAAEQQTGERNGNGHGTQAGSGTYAARQPRRDTGAGSDIASFIPEQLTGQPHMSGPTREEITQDWSDISERIQLDMETFSRAQGDAAAGMMQNLREVNRERYDYTEFLKKFAVTGEAMRINDDEFDYVFYTYGMRLFPERRMPLIEPLEYKDVKRIREFVIAIDTSGSVIGEQVQAFLQKTYNILESTDSFFSKIDLHIIQCDADIQEHVRITTREEFDRYLKSMRIKGGGGTDFRPVFRLVDKLIAKKELSRLKGLIYFTDGYGTFPDRMPAYRTAFVFVQDGYEIPEVPVWAMKLILQHEDLERR